MIKRFIAKLNSSNLIRNFFILLFGSGIGSIINILNLSIMINTIGQAQNGMIIIIQTYTLLFSGIFSFKSFEALIKYLSVSIENNDIKKSKEYIKFSFLLDLISAIMATICAYLFMDIAFKIMGWPENLKPYINIYSITILFSITGTAIGIIRIYNQFGKFVKINVIISIIKFVLYIIAVINRYKFEYFLIVEFITFILNNIFIICLALYILYKNKMIDFYKVKLNIDLEYLKFNIYTSLYTTIDIPVQQLTTLIINKYLGFAEVSVYNVFTKIAAIILKIQEPLSQIIYPEMNVRIAKGSTEKASQLYKKISKIVWIVGIPIILIMGITYKYWIVIFIKDYKYYFVPLMIYMIYIIYTSASRNIHDLFIALGYVKSNIKILLVVNSIYVGLLYISILNLGLNGVILSLFIQAIMVIECKKFILKKDKYL